MKHYKEIFVGESFKQVLTDLLNEPEFVASPRDMEVREIRDCVIETGAPMLNLYKNKYRSSPLKYIGSELLWYFAGTNNPTFIEKYANMWKNLHNEDGTVNSAYGDLIFKRKNKHGLTQYQWIIESLKKDKDSRQAFMHFNIPDHQRLDNKDQVCTLQALFHIRNNELFMTVTMRSNDVIFGFMTDYAFFSVLMYHVFLHMKKYYPELNMGTYTHISHSMHLYARHYDLVKDMLKEPFKPLALPMLNDTILEENGQYKDKYKNIFIPIDGGFDIMEAKTDNDLLNYCIQIIK